MTFLADVNVLIALIDPEHVDHERATDWFADRGQVRWATCPIVQNGVIRIVGGASYRAVPLGCEGVAATLAEWCNLVGHEFWPDEVSLLDSNLVDRSRLTSPSRTTDIYLLALAASRNGRLATLDRRLSPDAVRGGAKALHQID